MGIEEMHPVQKQLGWADKLSMRLSNVAVLCICNALPGMLCMLYTSLNGPRVSLSKQVNVVEMVYMQVQIASERAALGEMQGNSSPGSQKIPAFSDRPCTVAET